MKALKLKKIVAVAVVAIGLAAGAVNVAFSDVLTDPDTEGVQLWKDGPYWATCNVGASKPEDYGYYFWWGDITGYRYLGGKWRDASGAEAAEPFKTDGSKCPTYNKDVAKLKSEGWCDSAGNLVSSCDAATAYLGAPWRMPTDAEFNALASNCDRSWKDDWNGTGVKGFLFTGKGDYASKSIFLPAAGYGYGSSLINSGSLGDFWSSTLYSGDSGTAWSLRFLSSYFNVFSNSRCFGRSVRPVRGFAK